MTTMTEADMAQATKDFEDFERARDARKTRPTRKGKRVPLGKLTYSRIHGRFV